jgi:hypothetical protein
MSEPDHIWAWVWNLPYTKQNGAHEWRPVKPGFVLKFKPWVVVDRPGWKFWVSRRTEFQQKPVEYVRADLFHDIAAERDRLRGALDAKGGGE